MSQRKSIERRIDYAIVFPVCCLLVLGLVSIYVATSYDFPQHVIAVMGQQVLWIAIGAALAFILMFFTTATLWKLTPWLYLLGLGLMILPLIFFSPQLVAATGAKNWITIGSVTLFQPSEFMKIAYILLMARATVWFKGKKSVSTSKTIGFYWGFMSL
ncbi:cell cycle protein, FtsW/RodA/SpoVE domain protein [Streptococcus dysgalactiae subsp. equisimilis SK1250]|nr:cell cycle protein, FtsW/RodA/SpoVE domain protein [Streptococcus dysgalactiae subsp. equisimilis SK1250]VTS36992.1 cell division protein [Streptococcus dysgalactiae subsp. equisimilis]